MASATLDATSRQPSSPECPTAPESGPQVRAAVLEQSDGHRGRDAVTRELHRRPLLSQALHRVSIGITKGAVHLLEHPPDRPGGGVESGAGDLATREGRWCGLWRRMRRTPGGRVLASRCCRRVSVVIRSRSLAIRARTSSELSSFQHGRGASRKIPIDVNCPGSISSCRICWYSGGTSIGALAKIETTAERYPIEKARGKATKCSDL